MGSFESVARAGRLIRKIPAPQPVVPNAMDLTYVDSKVREALVTARGSRVTAQRLVISAALRDERLMQGLAAPFLKAIAGAAIERVARQDGFGFGQDGGGRPARAPQTLSGDMLDAVLARMGQGGVPAPAATAANPRSGSGSRSMRVETAMVVESQVQAAQAARLLGGKTETQPAAGQRHETAIRAIAAAFARKNQG